MKIAIISGEKSGDNYGAMLIDRLRGKRKDLQILATGGADMRRRADSWVDIPLSKMGFWDVLKAAKKYSRCLKTLVSRIEAFEPSSVVLIDNPGFNLRLARALNRRFRCIYYIPPKIWAHNYGRIALLKRYIDTVIPIFPFEEEIYKREKVDCAWFGHPVVDIVNKTPSCKGSNGQGIPTVGILPGSRIQEIRYILPELMTILKKLRDKRCLRIILSASDKDIETLERDIIRYYNIDVEIITGTPYELINQSALIYATSGTVNLEAFLKGKPILVFYKTSWLNYRIARLIIRAKFISPVNLYAGVEAVPEHIQKFDHNKIIAESMDLIDKEASYLRQMNYVKIIMEKTASHNVTDRISDFILKKI